MKLMSNTSFGKQLILGQMDDDLAKSINYNLTDKIYRKLRENYDDFLSMPLGLWMFISCDDKGNILEEPLEYKEYLQTIEDPKFNLDYNTYMLCKQYKHSCEKLLFNDFIVSEEDGRYYISKGDLELVYNKKVDMWEHQGEDVYWDIEGLARFGENIFVDINITGSAIKTYNL